MTRAEERALLKEYVDRCDRLKQGFDRSCQAVATLLPMSAEQLDAISLDDETLVLAFLKRFEQFEDSLGRTLKAISKLMEHGKVERLTSVDVARRAWALGILADAELWADAVRARNTLAHEYPLNAAKRATQLNTAWAARDTLTDTWAAIQRFIEAEGLLA